MWIDNGDAAFGILIVSIFPAALFMGLFVLLSKAILFIYSKSCSKYDNT